MAQYSAVKITEGFYSIEMGYVRSFLVEGREKALLVDTGTGDGDLRNLVEGITKLPITVLFTHADGDHTGAAAQFDSHIMHPCEFDYYKSKKTETVAVNPIWEGDIIDLGNYRFEVILLPGHTPGSIALLEKEKRFLISGDSVQDANVYMFGPGRNIDAYRASLKKLLVRLEEFDIVYASHGTLDIFPNTVKLLYNAAGRLKAGELEGVPEERFDGKVKRYACDGVAFYAY